MSYTSNQLTVVVTNSAWITTNLVSECNICHHPIAIRACNTRQITLLESQIWQGPEALPPWHRLQNTVWDILLSIFEVGAINTFGVVGIFIEGWIGVGEGDRLFLRGGCRGIEVVCWRRCAIYGGGLDCRCYFHGQ